MTPDDTRRHILYKANVERTLPLATADRMLAELDRGETTDYQQLLAIARAWMPDVVYHTAPAAGRERIRTEGLRAMVPGPPNWRPDQIVEGQRAGVYVAAKPDVRGAWAHWNEWDVWEIDALGLERESDEMNPECWRLTADVGPAHLRLHASCSRTVDA